MATLHDSLQPFEPSSTDPFDAVKAAHLLNRAGFGGTPAEVEQIVALGPTRAVDALLNFPDKSAEEQNGKDVPEFSSIDGYPKTYRALRDTLAGKSIQERQELIKKFQMANAQADASTITWWLRRQAYGPYPLQEKLTLFWHGHFTSSAKDERMALLMWEQQELLRKRAAGNFGQFVRDISRDPAMLDYLNNTQNHKDHPNENYARELMELFTLGIGNYTEDDIKQSARAFTGWTHDGDQFIFNRRQHDDGDKTFMGQAGNFDGDDIISIILKQPACPKFIASKLYRYFVSDDLSDETAQNLADLFAGGQMELRPLLRTILTSRAFYSSDSIGAQIKCPIQLVVGTSRMMGLPVPPIGVLRGPLINMGQMPLLPPNVKGWPGGRNWINASTLFVRYNTAVFLVNSRSADGSAASPGGPEQMVDAWVKRLIQRPIDPAQRQVLIDAAGSQDDEQAQRHVIQLIVSMPEYQLC